MYEYSDRSPTRALDQATATQTTVITSSCKRLSTRQQNREKLQIYLSTKKNFNLSACKSLPWETRRFQTNITSTQKWKLAAINQQSHMVLSGKQSTKSYGTQRQAINMNLTLAQRKKVILEHSKRLAGGTSMPSHGFQTIFKQSNRNNQAISAWRTTPTLNPFSTQGVKSKPMSAIGISASETNASCRLLCRALSRKFCDHEG